MRSGGEKSLSRTMLYHDVKNVNDTGVPVGVGSFVLVRQNHDVSSCKRVDCILFLPQVIGGVIDTEQRVVVDAVVLDIDTTAVTVGKIVLIPIVSKTTDMS